MLYYFLKFLHVLGVVLLIGNVTITAFWKVFADRTGEPRLVAHAQYLVTLTDWIFTLAGIVLILVGGYGMVLTEGLDPFGASWLVWGQLLFLLSGVIWVAVLVPVQVRQARAARTFAAGDDIPELLERRAAVVDLGHRRDSSLGRSDLSHGDEALACSRRLRCRLESAPRETHKN